MEEKIYIEKNDVIFGIPHVDDAGNAVTPVSIDYTVIDKNHAEVIATVTATPDIGDSTLITIPSVSNEIPEGDMRDYRKISVVITTATDEYTHDYGYVIERSFMMIAGENSFQTYETSVLTAMDVANIPGWDSAIKQKRKAAMNEACINIGKLTFEIYLGLDHFQPGWKLVSMSSMTPDLLLSLDADMLKALKRAQILEANYLLGGDPLEDKRNNFLSETIGESSNMFRPGKPVKYPVCVRAFEALSKYVSAGKRISR